MPLKTKGTLSANPNDNVEHMRKVWSVFLEKNDDEHPHLDPDKFIEIFQTEITALKKIMILEDITQSDLYNIILNRREEAKGGLDSWRTIELQHVHPMFF